MKNTKPLFKALSLIILVTLIAATIYVVINRPFETQITSFDECVEAGYPVMESYPRQCAVPEGEAFVEEIDDDLEIANPASVYCIEQGGELEIREDEDGNQSGYCTIDGVECEEWEYYNNKCK